MKERSYAAPIVVLLMVLPLVYVGSYFALADPAGNMRRQENGFWFKGDVRRSDYRLGGATADRIFWPLEQIDRQLRPEVWPYPRY